MKKSRVIPMPPPKVEPEDGIVFSIGDDTFRVTASIEQVAPPKPGQVVPIDKAGSVSPGPRAGRNPARLLRSEGPINLQ